MHIEWREVLYPLGFLSSIAFSGRMLLQWLSSEYRQKSVVTRNFWILSLFGNLLLLIHSLIQVQYHVCFVQTCNAIISWRNLDLMKPESEQIKMRQVIILLAASLFSMTTLFFLQGYLLLEGQFEWFRMPSTPWNGADRQPVSLFIHCVGFIGIVLFSCRFWVQWWLAERRKKSYLGPLFWWLSLIGDLLSLGYFLRISDPVNFIGPAFGVVPYIRNLMLIRKDKRAAYEKQ